MRVKAEDDPALATLGTTLGVFWLLLTLAVPVCYALWLTLPLLLGAADASEVMAAAAALGAELLESLVSLVTLEWRWPELIDIGKLLEVLQAPFEHIQSLLSDLTWFLELSCALLALCQLRLTCMH